METKLNAAMLYQKALRRTKSTSVQEPKAFSTGGALMSPIVEDEEDTQSNLAIQDRVRALFSAQRQMLKGNMK